MKKIKKKMPTRYPRVYRVGFYDSRERLIYEPVNKFLAYRYVTESGRRKRDWETFPELDDARKHAGLEEEDVTPKAIGQTVKSAIAEFLWYYRKKADRPTLHKMQDHIKHFTSLFNDEMDSLDATRIDRLIRLWTSTSYLERVKSTRVSYFCELRSLRVFFNWYRTRKNNRFFVPILSEHWEDVKFRSKAPLYHKDLLPEEFDRFIAKLEELFSRDKPWIVPLAKLQFAIGGRAQEPAAIFYEDVNAKDGTIILRRRVQWSKRRGQKRKFVEETKNENWWIVPSKEGARICQEWAMRNGIRSGPLFLEEGQPLKYKSICYRYSTAFKKAGLEQRATHILRHASITEFKESTGDIYLTKAFARHKSVATTERYAKNRDETLRHALNLRDEKLKEKSLASVGQRSV